MSQSIRGSMVEAVTNTVVGFGLNFMLNAVLFAALIGCHIPTWANLTYGAIMTGVSVARGFTLRRFFNWLHTRRKT